jgi:hypothetical protein
VAADRGHDAGTGDTLGRVRPLAVRAVWLVVMAALLDCCQNDYPLAPTRCDDLCSATLRPACGDADPASCVAACEAEGGFSDDPECQQPWEAALRCFRELPDELACSWQFGYGNWSGEDCLAEFLACTESR